MHKFVTRLSVLKFATSDGLAFSRNPERTQIFRGCSGVLHQEKAEPKLVKYNKISFTSFVRHRQEEAKRSFLVQLDNTNDFCKLLSFCNNYGEINKIFHYKGFPFQYLLIEMSSEASLNSVLKKIQGIETNNGFVNQFVVLGENVYMNDRINTSKVTEKLRNITGRDVVSVPKIEKIRLLDREFNKCVHSLNEVILNCYSALKLTDLEIRKKFLMCRQIEVMCSGFLSNVVAFPFGSSVTGFGVHDCDLDIALLQISKHYSSMEANGKGLYTLSEEARVHLEIISQLMRAFLIGCTNINFIKHATVPIVKYKNSFTNVECDLSMYNLHGVAVSQIFYNLASVDWRIKALVIFIKIWAFQMGIVYKVPGSKLSNFSLTLLVMFFLQQIKMVPHWNVYPCTDCQFLSENSSLREIHSAILSRTRNNNSVEELFLSFLEYYRNFDFSQHGISLKEGRIIKNESCCPIFIENPIYPGVNVSKNVSKLNIKNAQKIFGLTSELLSKEKEKSLKLIFNFNLSEKK